VLHGMRHLYPVIVGEMCTIGHNATVQWPCAGRRCAGGDRGGDFERCAHREGRPTPRFAIPGYAAIPLRSLVTGSR